MERRDAQQLEELFDRYVDHFFLHSQRLYPTDLCAEDRHLLGPLRKRIAEFEDLNNALGQRRRLSAGQEIGPYRVEKILGQGGMGFVYKARDLENDRDVALKLFPPENEADAELVQRFRREARILEALDHPNIVGFHALQDLDDFLLIAMEYVDGRTLDQLVARHRLSFEMMLDLAIPLAHALECAHSHGVIHRDLKPRNVMANTRGFLKVLDFGLARLHESLLGATITRSGAIVGTLRYMAPDQLSGQASRASDTFSFGYLFLSLLSDKVPLRQGPTTVASSCPIVQRCWELLTDCVAFEPQNRPQLADLLHEFVEARATLADRTAQNTKLERQN